MRLPEPKALASRALVRGALRAGVTTAAAAALAFHPGLARSAAQSSAAATPASSALAATSASAATSPSTPSSASAATSASATDASATAPASSAVPWAGESTGDMREGLDPLPSTGRYLSYGFSFHSESLLAPGGVCPKGARESCILGAGGGISFSGAFRAPSYSLGAVYEASFHDSNNLYQRGVLQQLRGEWRVRPHAWAIGDSINGIVGVGGGVATYGDNWTMATLGAAGHGFFGADWDLGVKLSMSFLVSYRAIYFREFQDPAFQHRPAGLVHLLGLQLGLELHEPL